MPAGRGTASVGGTGGVPAGGHGFQLSGVPVDGVEGTFDGYTDIEPPELDRVDSGIVNVTSGSGC